MLELWDEMMGLERRMDDLFRTYLGPRARITFPAFREGLRRPFVPATDVFARKGDLVVRLELPGVDPKKDVKVTVDDGVLVIKGERESTEEIEDEDFYRMESCYGSFERDVPIPEGVKEKDIKAGYANGVLEIVMPGAAKPAVEPHEAKEIPIHTAAKAA